MHDLERVLEHVLAVTSPEPEPAEDLDEIFGEGSAVRLEDRLLPRLADDLFYLGFRLVVGLLDSRRVNPAVLEELRDGQSRHLSPESVERREYDRVRCVVDDEVHAGEVFEGADVATLPAD